MNSTNAALKTALSPLAEPIRRPLNRSGSDAFRTEVGELVLAEQQMRRKRLGIWLHLLDEEMRRNGDAAFPSGTRVKTVQRSGRSRHAA